MRTLRTRPLRNSACCAPRRSVIESASFLSFFHENEQVGHQVVLLLGHLDVVLGQHRVLLLDGPKLPVEHGLLLADGGEVAHDVAHVVEVGDLAREVALVRLDPLRDRLELDLRLLVQVARVLLLPRARLLRERRLERRRVERERADVVLLGDAHDLLLDRVVLLELRLKVLQRRALRHERLVRGLLVVAPEVVVLANVCRYSCTCRLTPSMAPVSSSTTRTISLSREMTSKTRLPLA